MGSQNLENAADRSPAAITEQQSPTRATSDNALANARVSPEGGRRMVGTRTALASLQVAREMAHRGPSTEPGALACAMAGLQMLERELAPNSPHSPRPALAPMSAASGSGCQAVVAGMVAGTTIARIDNPEQLKSLLKERIVKIAAFYADLRSGALAVRDGRLQYLRFLMASSVVWSPRAELQISKSNPLRVALLNPQGNFDADNTGLGDHADFGGQLIYVRELGLALARQGFQVDIITSRVDADPKYPGWGNRFASPVDHYRDDKGHAVENVRILRFDAGEPLPLKPAIGSQSVPPSTNEMAGMDLPREDPAGVDGPPGAVATSSRRAFCRKEELWPHLDQWASNIAAFYGASDNPAAATLGQYGDGGLAAALLKRTSGVPVATFTLHSGGAQKLDGLLPRVDDDLTTISEAPVLEDLHFPERIAAERLALSAAEHIVTSTREEKDTQYGHVLYDGIARPEIHVVPPGVNEHIFSPTASNDTEARTTRTIDAAMARDIPPERRSLPLVVLAGRLDPKKNHIAALRAFAQHPELREKANLMLLLTGGPDAFLRPDAAFAGASKLAERHLAKEMQELLQQSGMRGECVVVPGLSNTQKEIAAAFRYPAQHGLRGIFCHPAIHEPFGLMPIEAAASGLVVAVTKNGGPSEVFKGAAGEQYGELMDPLDTDDIARALTRTLDPDHWQALHQSGLSRVRQAYSWDAAARAYGGLVRDALGLQKMS